MGKVVDTCPECGREFTNYTDPIANRVYCSVGCQAGAALNKGTIVDDERPVTKEELAEMRQQAENRVFAAVALRPEFALRLLDDHEEALRLLEKAQEWIPCSPPGSRECVRCQLEGFLSQRREAAAPPPGETGKG